MGSEVDMSPVVITRDDIYECVLLFVDAPRDQMHLQRLVSYEDANYLVSWQAGAVVATPTGDTLRTHNCQQHQEHKAHAYRISRCLSITRCVGSRSKTKLQEAQPKHGLAWLMASVCWASVSLYIKLYRVNANATRPASTSGRCCTAASLHMVLCYAEDGPHQHILKLHNPNNSKHVSLLEVSEITCM